MKVVLELQPEVLEKLGELAKFQKRSRKNFMEYVLINHTECADYESPESIIGINPKPKKEIQKITPDEIQKQIEAILAEKIPPERNTVMGRKSWAKEQEKRINDLKNNHQ